MQRSAIFGVTNHYGSQQPCFSVAVFPSTKRVSLKTPIRQGADNHCHVHAHNNTTAHLHALVAFQQAGGLGAHVRHCPVKRRARAIEKLFRSYHGDPGWLIDLVRASITFETLESLLTCFERIRADARIAILQIKNRFDLEFDSAESAGYVVKAHAGPPGIQRSSALVLCCDNPSSLRRGLVGTYV